MSDISENGSCWDEGPCVIGQSMGPLCGLKSGHAGAHRSGHSEWTHRSPGGTAVSDPVVRPNYYVMPDGKETIGITRWLTSAGGQAVQYIVRATRTDGVVKDKPIQDLEKALFWIADEINRLKKQERRASDE